MKNTIVPAVLLTTFLFIFSKTSLALLPLEIRDDIQLKITIVPTATPTPASFKQIKPNITIRVMPTVLAKATATPTVAPSVTPTVTPEPTSKTELTATPIISPEPSVQATKTRDKTENKFDLKTLFMGITIGLLILIILIQVWPKKKKLD